MNILVYIALLLYIYMYRYTFVAFDGENKIPLAAMLTVTANSICLQNVLNNNSKAVEYFLKLQYSLTNCLSSSSN